MKKRLPPMILVRVSRYSREISDDIFFLSRQPFYPMKKEKDFDTKLAIG